MSQICVTLTEETTRGIVDRMAELHGVADLFEIRGDMVLDLDLLTILRAKTRPLLYTCRAYSEGGRLDDEDPRRRMSLLEAVKRGFDYVDVEYRSGLIDVMMEKAGNGLVLSFHDLEGTPEDLDGLYSAICEKGADIVKIAVTPRSIADVGRLMAFAALTTSGGGPPLIAVALGPLGILTRIAAGRMGSPFTYACASAGAEAAEGQLPADLMSDLYRVRDVTPATKLYGILGADVTRSFSPILHNRALEARNIDAVYVPLQAENLQAFVEALPSLGLSGFSVTRPYKNAILPFLNEVDEAAALCGSVNTVVVQGDGLLRGSTTDGIGVLVPLRKKIDLKDKTVVMIGAGGAARAASLALIRKGAKVRIVARRVDAAQELAATLNCASGDLAKLADYEWDVLVNATPTGSREQPDESPVPANLHRPGSVVFDMVYDPLETRLLREAQAAGCTVVDGLEMLIAQAAVQFETWTGQEAPLDVMKASALYLAQEQER